MADETITVKTEAGKSLNVVVISKSAEGIWVALGEGIHNVKCKLTPTNNGLAYAGSVMGREIIYERSVKQVKDDLVKAQREQDRYRVR